MRTLTNIAVYATNEHDRVTKSAVYKFNRGHKVLKIRSARERRRGEERSKWVKYVKKREPNEENPRGALTYRSVQWTRSAALCTFCSKP